jgi:hypothetical protein
VSGYRNNDSNGETALPEDRFGEDAERVAKAAQAVNEALAATLESVENGCQLWRGGVPLADVIDQMIAAGMRGVRMKCADTFLEYERAILVMRANIVRTLVDHEGLTLTEVARKMRISRQACARLYRSTP